MLRGDDIGGAVVAPGRSLGKKIFVVPEMFVVLAVDSRAPLGLLDPHGLAFFSPCLPARSDCWMLEFS